MEVGGYVMLAIVAVLALGCINLTEWTDAWPQAWEEALSGFSGLFDNFGVSPRNDLTQGGTHP